MPSKVNFAENLRNARIAAGLTSTQLAQKSGFFCSVISRFEHGHNEPNLTNLVKLCKALGCSADVLLGIKKP